MAAVPRLGALLMSLDIVIPTYNSPHLKGCLRSILANTLPQSYRQVVVVNNGGPLAQISAYENPRLRILNQTTNLGYEQGIEAGCRASDAEQVLFLNDDTFIPPMRPDWLDALARHLSDPTVGAVGPCSNQVMGYQNIFCFPSGLVLEVPFLTGLCLLVRRAEFLPLGFDAVARNSGADIDLSFRLRQQGFCLRIDRGVFVFHYGGETGTRLYGTAYDGAAMQQQIEQNLRARHGSDTVDRDYLNPSYGVVQ